MFLSFRGHYTRTNFVDQLYAALVHIGVDTFKDDEMLCGVFHVDWKYYDPRIIFKIVNDEKVIPESEVDIASSAANNCNLWVTYILFGFFQKM